MFAESHRHRPPGHAQPSRRGVRAVRGARVPPGRTVHDEPYSDRWYAKPVPRCAIATHARRVGAAQASRRRQSVRTSTARRASHPDILGEMLAGERRPVRDELCWRSLEHDPSTFVASTSRSTSECESRRAALVLTLWRHRDAWAAPARRACDGRSARDGLGVPAVREGLVVERLDPAVPEPLVHRASFDEATVRVQADGDDAAPREHLFESRDQLARQA